MLRSGRRAMVMQVDVYGDGEGDEALLATATVNFAVINGATPKLPDWPPA
jgi:acyl-coenzyme A thioesterase PaaI-like protein